jgi:hypothetical protein
MPQEIHITQPRALACRGFFVAVVAAAIGCLSSPILHAESPALHGYITAIHPPDGFDVNGEHVATTPDTKFGAAGAKTGANNPVGNGPTRDALQIGAWVEVFGERDRQAKTIVAKTVLIRDDWDGTLSGLGAIDHVVSTAPELVFAADGYRIRVTPATEVKLAKDMKSAADAHAGLWVLYEGRMGPDGLLVASKARFVSTDHGKPKSGKAPSASNAPAATPQSALNASFQTDVQTVITGSEVQIGNDTYTISKDQALQSRVNQIGMNLVPTWVLQLPVDNPAKIQFSFIAVNNGAHEALTFADSKGLILVPAQLATRFKNDDQLAAVLADGIANSLQQQAPTVIQFSFDRTTLAEGAGLVATGFIPYAGPVVETVGGRVMMNKYERAMNEQRWRMALQMMADAGYHPWQAPEAWRLAAPGKLPADTSTLKYPDRSGYQFAILNLMYKKFAPTDAAASVSVGNSNASKKP